MVPAQQMQALSELFMSHLRRNVPLSSELDQLLTLFGAHDISAIPVKGLMVAENCYGNTALRASGDLDLLVSREAVPQAIRLLRERGYVPCLWRDKRFDDQ